MSDTNQSMQPRKLACGLKFRFIVLLNIQYSSDLRFCFSHVQQNNFSKRLFYIYSKCIAATDSDNKILLSFL